jgi:nucleotide-binding universal stress UspA family protein
MNKIKKILAPTDLSDLSKAGVRYAIDLAATTGAEVNVYHVVSMDEIMSFSREMKEWSPADYPFHPPPLLLERYHAALARFLEEHFSDLLPLVEIHKKVEFGMPDKNIIEEAAKEGVDLIVMSTHGRTGLSHVLLGSVTEKVVRHASCPVLSIRPWPKEGEKHKAAAA